MSEQGRENLERVEHNIEKAQQASLTREEWGAQRMVKWIHVEYATYIYPMGYRMEWKATILGDDEGSKCQPLVSRS